MSPICSLSTILSSLLLLCTRIPADDTITRQNGFEYHCLGDCKQTEETIARHPTPAVILLGGSTNIHDDAVRSLVQYSDGGNVLIIDTVQSDKLSITEMTESNDKSISDITLQSEDHQEPSQSLSANYLAFIHNLGLSHSVASVLIDADKTNEADFQWIVDRIDSAHGLFIIGEPCTRPLNPQCQSLYGAIESAVRDRNVPIAGILGTVSQSDSKYTDERMDSDTALIDPYDERMRLDEGPVDGLQLTEQAPVSVLSAVAPETIIDAQFSADDRCGLLIAWMARLRTENKGEAVRGIGIGRTAAIVVDLETNIGTVMGNDNDSVYVLTADHDPSVCEPAVPLTFQDVTVQKLAVDDEYDFDSWSGGRRALQYTVSAVNGELSPLDPLLSGLRGFEHLTPEQVRRERVHRLVIWVMVISCVVMVASASVFCRNHLLERQLKESQRCANEEDYHPLL